MINFNRNRKAPQLLTLKKYYAKIKWCNRWFLLVAPLWKGECHGCVFGDKTRVGGSVLRFYWGGGSLLVVRFFASRSSPFEVLASAGDDAVDRFRRQSRISRVRLHPSHPVLSKLIGARGTKAGRAEREGRKAEVRGAVSGEILAVPFIF